jgi:flagellar M-ring protein FliF
VRDTGTVDRLSVAVLVDGTYETGADGAREYVARGDAELEQIRALVQSAVGYDADRGDTVEVVNMPFVSAEEAMFPDDTGTLMGMSRDDWFRIAEIAVLGIVAVLVILLVVRPLLMRVLDGTQEAAAGDAFDGFLPDGTMQRTALAGPQSGMGALTPADLHGGESGDDEENDDLDAMIDINQVSGRVRASSLKKVGDIVEKHPEEAGSIIRNWLYQET